MAIFKSNKKPQSKIINKSFNYRLASLFGWRPASGKRQDMSDFEKSTGIKFVRVDIDNPAYRVKQAALGNVFKKSSLTQKVDKLFNSYLNETSIVYSDIQERQERLSELRFAVTNSPYLSRVCRLAADEATQRDDLNRLISVEAQSVNFSNRCYELFAQWGLTQQRIAATCYEIEEYGEAVWINKVTQNGVEKITPVKTPSLVERLEFSPVHMAEVEEQLQNGENYNKSRKSKIDQLLDLFKNEQKLNTLNEDFADLYDTKLLGYEFHDNIIAPPWNVTHFRYNADSSEFFPYGTPPLLFCLAPFKRSYSLWTLQGLARAASFPVQLYTVKGTEGVGVQTAFDTVNEVREEYENIGVTPSSNSIEVYTVNTKVWAPDGLLDMKILESKVDYNFVDDINLADDEVAFASGVPRGYLDPSKDGWGTSGIALTEQFKPFARHVYTIQSCFLEELGNLIRLHFAITGEFDYNTPFVLSMRFPAEEMSQDKRDARTASIDLSKSIVDLIKQVLGIGDEDPLPEDVVSDILSKYSFLDPTDLQRWIRLSSIAKLASNDDEDNGGGGGGDDSGGDDFDFGGGEDDTGGDDLGGDAGGDDLGGGDIGGDTGGAEPAQESSKMARDYYLKTKKLLNEKRRLKEQARLREVSKRYFESRNAIYLEFLKENHITEFDSGFGHGTNHCYYVPPIKGGSSLSDSIKVLRSGDTSSKKLNESLDMKDIDISIL